MKLRLPHRLHAALVAALASVSFTTLCSGALTAAFFLGSQAFAEEAADNPGATIDIGDTNLDAQAAIDEEEGKGEAQEPGSAPINQAGFNGIRGSNDDFDRQSTAEAATESSIDTENVGTADQANYTGTSADLPSNDLGFTSNSYAIGTESSSSDSVFQVTATPATAVPAVQQVQYMESTTPTTSSGTTTTGAATGGYSATPVSGATGGGSGYNLSSPAMPRAAVVTVPATTDATAPAAESAKTDSGSADSSPADELGSSTPNLSVGGASLVRASYFAPAPAMLGSTTTQNTSTTKSLLSAGAYSLGSPLGTSGGFGTVQASPTLYGAINSSIQRTDMTNWAGYDAKSKTAIVGSMGESNKAGAVFSGSQSWNSEWSFVVTVDAASLTSSPSQTLFAADLLTGGSTGYAEGVKLTTANGSVTITMTSWSSATVGTETINLSDVNDLTFVMTHYWQSRQGDLEWKVYKNGDFSTPIYTVTQSGQKFTGSYLTGVQTGGLGEYPKHPNGGNKSSLPADSSVGAFVMTGGAYTLGSMITTDDLNTYYASVVPTVLTWNGGEGSATWNTSAQNWKNNDMDAVFDGNAIAIFGDSYGVSREVSLGESLSAYEIKVKDDYTLNLGSYNLSTTAEWDIASDKALMLNGTGTAKAWTITGGGTLVNNAHLQLGGMGNSTISSSISGCGDLTKVDQGTLTLSGNNTFTGGLTVNEGTVSVMQTSSLGSGPVTVNENGTILFTSNDFASIDNISVSGAGKLRLVSSIKSENRNALNTVNATNLYLADNAAHTGRYYYDAETNLSAVQHLYLDGGQLWVCSNMQYEGDVTFNATTYSETGSLTRAALRVNNTATFKGNVNVAATTQFAWCSNSVVEFAGTTLGSGNLFLKRFNSNGTFKVSGDASGYQGSMTSDAGITLDVAAGSKLNLAGGSNLAGAVTVAGSLTMNSSAGTSSFIGGAVSGSGSITKSGEGTLTLSGNNSYSGGTTVTGGTLVASHGFALGTGDVKVDAGALELTTTVSLGGDLTMGEGTTLKFAGSQMLDVGGTLTLNGGASLDLSNVIPFSHEDSITLATANSISGNLQDINLVNLLAPEGYRGVLTSAETSTGTSLVLTFAQVGRDLIWDNNAQDNTWSGNNWHTADATESHIAFTENDNVQFTAATPDAAPVLTANANAGTMTIDSTASVNVNTGGFTLTVEDLDTAGGTLSKSGAGEASFGGADAEGVTLAALTVSEGTASFAEKVTVIGDVTMSTDPTKDATLNLNGGAMVSGKVNARYGTINVWGESTFDSLDIYQEGSSTAQVVVKDGGILTLGDLKKAGSAKLVLEQGGAADLLGKVWVKGLAGSGEVLGAGTCSIDSADITLKNVAVTAHGMLTIGNKLLDSTLTVNSYVTLTNEENALTATTVTAERLIVAAGMHLGAVSVTGGELSLTSSGVTIGSGSIEAGGKLTLSPNAPFKVDSGVFSFASDAILDLSALAVDGKSAITLGTASDAGSFSTHNLGNVILYFGSESTYDNAYLEVDENRNLVLNFVQPKEVLYWKGGPGTWDKEAMNWYPSGDITQKVAFKGGENIVFSVQGESLVTVTVLELTTGDVVVEQGVNLSLSSANGTALTAGKVDVKGNLTVTNVAIQADSLNIERGSHVTADVQGERKGALATNVSGTGNVTKTGSGSLELTGDNSEFSGKINIEQGSVIASNAKALGDTPNVTLSGGSLEGSIAPSGDISITATQNASVSANIQVAAAHALTFNTDKTITASGSITGAGDIYKEGKGLLELTAENSYSGNLNINAGSVLVSHVGALGDGAGTQSVTVASGSNLTFKKDVAAEGEHYEADKIVLQRGSTLTFSGTDQLHINTLNLTAAAAVDISQIALNGSGDYVLASVDQLEVAEPGIWKEGGNLLQFISMTGITPAEGFSITPDAVVSLHYKNNQLVLTLNDPHAGFYWKPSETPGVREWNVTEENWSSNSGLTNNVKFVNGDVKIGGSKPKSVYFLDAGTDKVEHISLGVEGTINILDMVVAGGEYWFEAPEGSEKEIHMQTEELANFVVRSGATAHFVGSMVTDGNFNVMHICKDATLDIQGTSSWGAYSMNNEGTVNVKAKTGYISSLLGHVDNSGEMTLHFADEVAGWLQVGELMNREGATMSLAAPMIYLDFASAMTGEHGYGDGKLHNMGILEFDSTGYNITGVVDMMLPVVGTGSMSTKGDATVQFDDIVEQTSVVLGSTFTVMNGRVTVADSTTVAAGVTVALSAGGSLGTVEMGDNAILRLSGDGATPEEYQAGTMVAGEGSTLDVEKDAAITIASYNADTNPVGSIRVGNMAEGDTALTPAVLTVEGEANVHSLTVMDGTAHLHRGGSVISLTQSGGSMRFCSNSYLQGGSVSGGSLDIGDSMVLTLGSVINVTSGSYTLLPTTGSINADALKLGENMGNAGYVEVGATVEAKTPNRSGFLNGGQQYVKVFDVQDGATLISNGVTVTHKEAAGPMTLIGTGDTAHPDMAGYGYLDASQTVYASYYVRDNYVAGVPDSRDPDYVKLSDVMETSKNGGTTPQLETVVFDTTTYNEGKPVTGSLTVDVQGQHADLFDVKKGAVGVVSIGKDADKARVMLCCCEEFDKVNGQMLIAGTGIYQLENRGTLGGGVSLLADTTEGIGPWTGTVRITGSGKQLVMAPLAVGSGANASEIEFFHWSGSFKHEGETPVESDAKILLTGTGMDAAPAITLTPGDANMKWTNTVTGNNARIVNHEGGNFSLTMTGDTSGWNGTLDQGRANTTMNVSFLLDTTTASGQGANATVQNAGLLTHDGIMNATYGGGIKTVNGDVQVYENGTINLHYTGTEMQVNSNIEKFLKQGELSITVGDGSNQASATFSGKFTNTETTTMTVEAGSSATIDTDATLLRVVGGQGSSVNVTSGSTLSLASTDPAESYSRFYGVNNSGTISMMASGGDIKLVDTTGHTDAFNLGNLVLADTPGTAAIETSGVNGQTTNVNITALSGTTNVLKLTNDNGVGTVNYNLGGAGSTAEFSGTVAYGVKAGTGGAAANLVLKNGKVAANAVLETSFATEQTPVMKAMPKGSANEADPATADIVVDTAHAEVLGLTSDATSEGKSMKVYGTAGGNKLLEITGDGNYVYAGKLGENLDIAYTGTGSQTIKGGVANFNGKVTVDNGSNAAGVLEILNATSVDITELTIGANDTLDLNDGGGNVGTAVVSGSVVAKGGSTTGGSGTASKVDGSLTLGKDASYNVSAAGGVGGLDLGGALTITQGATLFSGDIAKIYQMEIGDMYDLAFDVTKFNGSTTASGFKDKVSFGNPIDASTLFGDDQFWEGEYYVCFSGAGTNGGKGGNVGTVYLYKATPEPTTGTLSLLALAALAARRRRK